MPTASERELERLLSSINLELKQILPKIADPEIRKVIEKVENISRWKRHEDPQGYDFAFARAKAKAQEQGEPFVVVGNDEQLVVVSRKRLLEEKPFGYTEKDVLYASDTGVSA